MDRRNFLKMFGVIGVTIPIAAAPALPAIREAIAGLDVVKRVGFSRRATFRRYSDGRWVLEFASDDRLDVGFNNEMVIAIEDTEYILSEITDIQISTEYLAGWSKSRDVNRDRDYIHWLTGNKWTEVNSG